MECMFREMVHNLLVLHDVCFHLRTSWFLKRIGLFRASIEILTTNVCLLTIVFHLFFHFPTYVLTQTA